MFRLLFWVAVIAAAVWLWRRFNRPAAPSAKPDEDQPAPMVRCAQCGVHVPRDKALPQEQRWYCSQAHLEQGQPRQ
jgi:uncharacterized protein